MPPVPPPELIAIVERATAILAEMIVAENSGTVTIGYGNKGLRLVVQRHERSVTIKQDSKDLRIRKASGS